MPPIMLDSGLEFLDWQEFGSASAFEFGYFFSPPIFVSAGVIECEWVENEPIECEWADSGVIEGRWEINT